MGDDPAIVDLAKAGGVANQHVQYSAVGERAAEPLQTMAESDPVVGCDMQVAQFTVDRAIECREPLGESVLEGV